MGLILGAVVLSLIITGCSSPSVDASAGAGRTTTLLAAPLNPEADSRPQDVQVHPGDSVELLNTRN